MTEWQIQIKEYETDDIMNKWDHNKIKSSEEFPIEYKYKKGENIVNVKHEFAENTGMGFIFSSRKENKEFNFLDKFDYLLSKLMVAHEIAY